MIPMDVGSGLKSAWDTVFSQIQTNFSFLLTLADIAALFIFLGAAYRFYKARKGGGGGGAGIVELAVELLMCAVLIFPNTMIGAICSLGDQGVSAISGIFTSLTGGKK